MAKHLLTICTSMLLCWHLIMPVYSNCPPSSKVQSCSPTCYKDSDCALRGGSCCPNICNEKSCVDKHLLGNSGSKYDKYGSGSGSVYCGNVKCSPFEKCGLDRNTKREKCVRA